MPNPILSPLFNNRLELFPLRLFFLATLTRNSPSSCDNVSCVQLCVGSGIISRLQAGRGEGSGSRFLTSILLVRTKCDFLPLCRTISRKFLSLFPFPVSFSPLVIAYGKIVMQEFFCCRGIASQDYLTQAFIIQCSHF